MEYREPQSQNTVSGQMNLKSIPPTTFREVRDIMLQPAPWAEHEIEELMHQEPLPPNRGLMLPADEEPTETQPTYINTP